MTSLYQQKATAWSPAGYTQRQLAVHELVSNPEWAGAPVMRSSLVLDNMTLDEVFKALAGSIGRKQEPGSAAYSSAADHSSAGSFYIILKHECNEGAKVARVLRYFTINVWCCERRELTKSLENSN